MMRGNERRIVEDTHSVVHAPAKDKRSTKGIHPDAITILSIPAAAQDSHLL
jgi:hypothetical protein